MNYDVFISSKSEDYHFVEEVYNFLKTNGLSVFIASEELKKIGEAQYANAIDEVLDDSKRMKKRDIDIYWEEHKPFIPDQEWPVSKAINGEIFSVELGNIKFDMVRIEGDNIEIGATKEEEIYAENNEYPAHN